MLEKEMEIGIAACPRLFIESGLSLVKRQVVINGRRPDILFTDFLSRHLLVEVQSGRLDESHVQRHFYYFFDYRALFPDVHLRLMFIANRIAPQHKEFLDDHGYEFKEYPEQTFERLLHTCRQEVQESPSVSEEPIETCSRLDSSVHQVLFEIEQQPMTMCYKMLLLEMMADLSDSEGRVPIRKLAEGFQEFFLRRSLNGKQEENPNRVPPNVLSTRSLSKWEQTIRQMPVAFLTPDFVIDEGSAIRWAPRIQSIWSPELKQQIARASQDRLVRYFTRHVPGGY
jgi:hypothetical protein